MRGCMECGKPLTGFHASAEFCAADCRKAFNNRRAVRGAELYDLFMAARFDRPLAATLKIWGWLAKLASQYRQEDKRERAGRRSWRAPQEIATRRPYLKATIMDRGKAA